MAKQCFSTETPQYQSSSLSFTQGFFLGQISVVVLVIFFIKFFIFGEPPSVDYSTRRSGRQLRSYSSSHRRSTSFSSGFTSSSKKLSSVVRTSPPSTTTSILAKTYYNVNGHQPESLDWFNVLIAQTIAQIRNDAQQDDAILTSLTNVLNGPHKPDFIDEIKVTEVNVGEEFPIFSNCRINPIETHDMGGGGDITRPSSSAGDGGSGSARLQARMDVDLSDAITLGIETKLVLNYPKPFVAVMPVALAVSIVRFSGTLSISFIPSPSTSPSPTSGNTGAKDTPTTLTFSFLPDYRLELSTHSLLGSRSRLQDVPKIAQLVETRLHAWFDERCVEPRFQQVALPSLWPRRKNTRGGEVDETLNDGEEDGGGRDAKTGTRHDTTSHRPHDRDSTEHSKVYGDTDIEIVSQSKLKAFDSKISAQQGGFRQRRSAEHFPTASLSGFGASFRMPGSLPQ